MQDGFFKEFVRVQFDKLTLLGLVVFLSMHHAPDLWTGAVLGALLTLIQGQRFKFPQAGRENSQAPPLKFDKLL